MVHIIVHVNSKVVLKLIITKLETVTGHVKPVWARPLPTVQVAFHQQYSLLIFVAFVRS